MVNLLTFRAALVATSTAANDLDLLQGLLHDGRTTF